VVQVVREPHGATELLTLEAAVEAVVLAEPPAQLLVALEALAAEVLGVHIALQAQEQRVLLIVAVVAVVAVVTAVAEHLLVELAVLVL
jgi:hypothetical protein